MKMSKKEFKKYFNKYFWKAFRGNALFYRKEDLNEEYREKILDELYEEILNRKYYPSIPKINLYQEKNIGIARCIPVFEIKDYCLYYFCIKQIEDKIAFNRTENTYGGWSLGGKFRKAEDEEIEHLSIEHNSLEDIIANELEISISTYSFNPKAWSKAYGDLNSKLYSTIVSNDYKFCIEIDIANFYDSINLDLLELWIREIGDKENSEQISILFHFLRYWNRNDNCYNRKTIGIPQDALADCSRILANFYLQDYDQFAFEICQANKLKYFRYADDQFIFGNTEKDLKNAVFEFSKKLNSINLNINSKKAYLWKVDELLDYRSFKLFDLVSKENISAEGNIEKFVTECIKIHKKNDLSKIKTKGSHF
jgi:hypothetical protein